MDCKLIHLYPDLMSLYGSYANVSLLQRMLEQMGNTVTVERVAPGETADLSDADFLFLGAGTERAVRFAAEQLLPQKDAIHAAVEQGTVLFFAGTGMELLGKTLPSGGDPPEGPPRWIPPGSSAGRPPAVSSALSPSSR